MAKFESKQYQLDVPGTAPLPSHSLGAGAGGGFDFSSRRSGGGGRSINIDGGGPGLTELLAVLADRKYKKKLAEDADRRTNLEIEKEMNRLEESKRDFEETKRVNDLTHETNMMDRYAAMLGGMFQRQIQAMLLTYQSQVASSGQKLKNVQNAEEAVKIAATLVDAQAARGRASLIAALYAAAQTVSMQATGVKAHGLMQQTLKDLFGVIADPSMKERIAKMNADGVPLAESFTRNLDEMTAEQLARQKTAIEKLDSDAMAIAKRVLGKGIVSEKGIAFYGGGAVAAAANAQNIKGASNAGTDASQAQSIKTATSIAMQNESAVWELLEGKELPPNTKAKAEDMLGRRLSALRVAIDQKNEELRNVPGLVAGVGAQKDMYAQVNIPPDALVKQRELKNMLTLQNAIQNVLYGKPRSPDEQLALQEQYMPVVKSNMAALAEINGAASQAPGMEEIGVYQAYRVAARNPAFREKLAQDVEAGMSPEYASTRMIIGSFLATTLEQSPVNNETIRLRNQFYMNNKDLALLSWTQTDPKVADYQDEVMEAMTIEDPTRRMAVLAGLRDDMLVERYNVGREVANSPEFINTATSVVNMGFDGDKDPAIELMNTADQYPHWWLPPDSDPMYSGTIGTAIPHVNRLNEQHLKDSEAALAYARQLYTTPDVDPKEVFKFTPLSLDGVSEKDMPHVKATVDILNEAQKSILTTLGSLPRPSQMTTEMPAMPSLTAPNTQQPGVQQPQPSNTPPATAATSVGRQPPQLPQLPPKAPAPVMYNQAPQQPQQQTNPMALSQ